MHMEPWDGPAGMIDCVGRAGGIAFVAEALRVESGVGSLAPGEEAWRAGLDEISDNDESENPFDEEM